MSRAVAYDVDAARKRLRLTWDEVYSLVDRDRTTVWRWRDKKRCPPWVKRILEQQFKIRQQAAQLVG